MADQIIETAATTLALKNGMLYIRSKGALSTAATVTETISAAKKLSTGGPIPVFFDARLWPGGDPGGWLTVISQMRSAFSAAAMLVDPESPPVGQRFDPVDRLLIPFRIFTDEAEAMAFLEPFTNSR